MATASAELKTRLEGLKKRGDALITKREGLIREATIQEQNRARAIEELEELGYKVDKLSPEKLKTLEETLTQDLEEAIGNLEAAVKEAEAAVESVEQE